MECTGSWNNGGLGTVKRGMRHTFYLFYVVQRSWNATYALKYATLSCPYIGSKFKSLDYKMKKIDSNLHLDVEVLCA